MLAVHRQLSGWSGPGGSAGLRAATWRHHGGAILGMAGAQADGHRGGGPIRTVVGAGERAAAKWSPGAGAAAGCGERVRCGRGRAARTVLRPEVAEGAEATLHASAEGARLPRRAAAAQPYSAERWAVGGSSVCAKVRGEGGATAQDRKRLSGGPWELAAARDGMVGGLLTASARTGSRSALGRKEGRAAEGKEAGAAARAAVSAHAPARRPRTQQRRTGQVRRRPRPRVEQDRTSELGRRPRRSSPRSMRSVGLAHRDGGARGTASHLGEHPHPSGTLFFMIFIVI